jgi:hypothetical protein
MSPPGLHNTYFGVFKENKELFDKASFFEVSKHQNGY